MSLRFDIFGVLGTDTGKRLVAALYLPSGLTTAAAATITGGTVTGAHTITTDSSVVYLGLGEDGTLATYRGESVISALPNTTDRPYTIEVREVDDATDMESYAEIAAAFEAATEVVGPRQPCEGAMKGGWIVGGAWSVNGEAASTSGGDRSVKITDPEDLMTREVTVELIENNTPVTTATVTLSDEAAVYGIRRADTDATVVAAGTSVPHTSGGVYVYSFTTAVEGIAYEARVKIQWPNGDIEYVDRPLIAVVETVLPTYNTDAEALALANALGLANYLAADAPVRSSRRQAASPLRVDQSRRWQGRKFNYDADLNVIEQQQEFPRLDHDDRPIAVDPSDPTSMIPVVPRDIKIAEMYEVESLILGARKDRVDAQHDGLMMQTVSSLSEQYRAPTNGQGIPVLCPEADMLCRRYALRSGRLL